jgi:hypothetical protein
MPRGWTRCWSRCTPPISPTFWNRSRPARRPAGAVAWRDRRRGAVRDRRIDPRRGDRIAAPGGGGRGRPRAGHRRCRRHPRGSGRAAQERILDALEDADRVAVEQAMAYPEYSAGRLMQREVVVAPEHWTVGEAIDYLRGENQPLPDQFYHVMLTDPRMKPVGYVTLGRILSSRRAMCAEARSPKTVSAPSPPPMKRPMSPISSTSIT